MKKVIGILSLVLLSGLVYAKGPAKDMWDQTLDDIKKVTKGTAVRDVAGDDGDHLLCYGSEEAIGKCFYFKTKKLVMKFVAVSAQYTEDIKVEPFIKYLSFLLSNEIKAFGREPDARTGSPGITIETLGSVLKEGALSLGFSWQETKLDLLFTLMVFQEGDLTIIMRQWSKFSNLESME